MKMSKSEAGRLGGLAWKRTAQQITKQAIEEYDKDPKACLQCSGPISYKNHQIKIFCCRSCATTYHNRLRPRKDKPRKISRTEILFQRFINGELSGRPSLKKILIGLRGYACEGCKQETWQGQPIPLELDHISGNAGDNKQDNLRLLCPNCHALTPTAKGKNRGSDRAARGLPTN